LAFTTMPVSRGRKPRPKKLPASQKRDQQARLPQLPKTRWEKIRDHPVPWTIALLAALLAIGAPVWQAFVAPDISIDTMTDSSRPFAFPFIVTNESWLFAMRDTELNCGIYEIKWAGGSGIAGLTLKDSKRATIKPGASGLFTCSIKLENGPGSGFTLVRGHLTISVNYWMLGWIPRRSPETEFTWVADGNPPHWVKGAAAIFSPTAK
jgi:hypothetical protein